jgi:hypothetical protein
MIHRPLVVRSAKIDAWIQLLAPRSVRRPTPATLSSLSHRIDGTKSWVIDVRTGHPSQDMASNGRQSVNSMLSLIWVLVERLVHLNQFSSLAGNKGSGEPQMPARNELRKYSYVPLRPSTEESHHLTVLGFSIAKFRSEQHLGSLTGREGIVTASRFDRQSLSGKSLTTSQHHPPSEVQVTDELLVTASQSLGRLTR